MVYVLPSDVLFYLSYNSTQSSFNSFFHMFITHDWDLSIPLVERFWLVNGCIGVSSIYFIFMYFRQMVRWVLENYEISSDKKSSEICFTCWFDVSISTAQALPYQCFANVALRNRSIVKYWFRTYIMWYFLLILFFNRFWEFGRLYSCSSNGPYTYIQVNIIIGL